MGALRMAWATVPDGGVRSSAFFQALAEDGAQRPLDRPAEEREHHERTADHHRRGPGIDGVVSGQTGRLGRSLGGGRGGFRRTGRARALVGRRRRGAGRRALAGTLRWGRCGAGGVARDRAGGVAHDRAGGVARDRGGSVAWHRRWRRRADRGWNRRRRRWRGWRRWRWRRGWRRLCRTTSAEGARG